MTDSKHVLIAAPICEDSPDVLRSYLEALEGVRTPGFARSYYFIDNIKDKAVAKVLHEWAKDKACTIDVVKPMEGNHRTADANHQWSDARVEFLCKLRNMILRHGRDHRAHKIGCRYIFTVDSDILVAPDTFELMSEGEATIVSGVMWTDYSNNGNKLPNVWLDGCYNVPNGWMQELKTPGRYKVGGLGAITLIDIENLHMDAGYDVIDNLGIEWWGEDRFFCVRARALGATLEGDTRVEAHHAYRDSMLAECREKASWL